MATRGGRSSSLSSSSYTSQIRFKNHRIEGGHTQTLISPNPPSIPQMATHGRRSSSLPSLSYTSQIPFKNYRIEGGHTQTLFSPNPPSISQFNSGLGFFIDGDSRSEIVFIVVIVIVTLTNVVGDGLYGMYLMSSIDLFDGDCALIFNVTTTLLAFPLIPAPLTTGIFLTPAARFFVRVDCLAAIQTTCTRKFSSPPLGWTTDDPDNRHLL
ncbi:hypothetical protein Acr_04g0001430 [Actinidia rufa]|uniref:Uncharacterized protein n=1 Tax=Actinidia rufa TaxID=165716 RepID=A0A7J0EG15_9ERIC|nr:hypothetical protein Acr_04g0001430 [Actinidia rufa]